MGHKIQYELSGPDGNVFAVMSYARKLGEELDMPVRPTIEEMTQGDYNHLLSVFNEHFGDYVELTMNGVPVF